MAEEKATIESSEEKVDAKATAESKTSSAAAKTASAKKQTQGVQYRRTARGKRRVMKKISKGRAYVKSTYNNTIVTLTDVNGNTIAWSSAGNCGFKGPKKATPYAASTIVKKVTEISAEYGLKDIAVFLNGIGSGRDAAIRALNANGFNITSITDITPLPHNGCRLAGRRRM